MPTNCSPIRPERPSPSNVNDKPDATWLVAMLSVRNPNRSENSAPAITPPIRPTQGEPVVAVTPAELMMTAEDKRTVNLARVEVWVGDDMILEITDPTELLRLDGDASLPKLDREVEVVVKAWVRNESESDLQPNTFGFLHVLHANRDAIEWSRRAMTLMEDDEGGLYYEGGWLAHRLGRAHIGIDMIDAQTFQTLTEDDYRGNAWGIPYRIVGPNGEESEGEGNTGGEG